MDSVIKIKDLSKAYQLGQFTTGTLVSDFQRWWALLRGREDPFMKVGEENERTQKGEGNIVWSLSDINLDIKGGDAVGVIGRNGAGKSTLLKILSQVTSPTTGEVKIRGRIASLLEVGTGFHPELTGRENVFLNGAILGMRKHEISSKFDEIIAFAGVERYIDTPVKRYSSGMYVRLAFAVAAHLESEILVVDEVLAVGDAEFQKKCIGKMDDVSKSEGRTIIFVSHNMASIRKLCDRGVYLKNGKLVTAGPIDETIDKYLMDISPAVGSSLSNVARSGTGMVQASEIALFTRNGETNSVLCGESVRLRVKLDSRHNLGSVRGRIDIGINTNFDERIAWLSTSIFRDNIDLVSGECLFDLDKIPLAPGHYTLNIYIECDNVVSDWIQNVFPFEVVESDFYSTGRIIPKGQGNFFLDYKLA